MKTSRPRQEQHSCPFNFTLYWDSQHSRWYFQREGPGDNRHLGHLPVEPEHILLPTKNIGEDNMKLTEQMMEANFTPASVRDFMENRTGQQLSTAALRHIRNKTRDTLLVHSSDVAIHPSHMSAADRLLANLDSSPNSSYVALFGEMDSDLLTIPKFTGRKKQRDNAAMETEHPSDDGEHFTVTHVDDTPLGTLEESPRSTAQRIRAQLKVERVEGSAKMLLAIAWTTAEQQRLAEMFPEVSCTDITEKTNAEKRPLILDVGKDGNNRNFTMLSAFLPSKARWVFDWYHGVAKPSLLSPLTLQLNTLNMTDEDEREISAFKALCGGAGKYPVATSRLCAWHKINRNLRKPESSSVERLT